MTITNDTIIKAARAAGLDVESGNEQPVSRIFFKNGDEFDPLDNDTDNALIRRGAEIDVEWYFGTVRTAAWRNTQTKGFQVTRVALPCDNDPAQAEREVVILCAAAKWDAMQGEKA